MKKIALLSFCFILFFCSKNNDPNIFTKQNLAQQTQKETPSANPSGSYKFYHGGQNRLYHYYQPLNLPKNAPLIFVLHGYNANADDFMDWFEMSGLANEHGFALVYPQGLKDSSRRTHWNAGLTLSNVDDVGFLSELALYLQETYQLNPAQTFTSGYSNGGFMSYELIVKKPEIFRAAASISGTMSLKTWSNRSLALAVPVLQLSGGLDRVVPPNGLTNLYGGWGGAPKISDIMLFWAELNTYDVREYIEQDQTKITKYLNSNSNNEVWYYLIEDLDHSVPMGRNNTLHTPSLIWEFFSKY